MCNQYGIDIMYKAPEKKQAGNQDKGKKVFVFACLIHNIILNGLPEFSIDGCQDQ